MSAHSSIEPLRQLSPVSDVEAGAAFGLTGREELLEAVTRLPVGRGGGTRSAMRGRRPLVLVFAAVAAAATAAAAWAILGSSARETTSVECVIAGSDSIVPSTSGDPGYDCAVAWQRELGTVPPPLVAYDNGAGGVTVIPRSQTPQAGWKRLPSGQDVALIQLQESLDDYIAGLKSGCLDGSAATALTNAKLTQFGFIGWTVTVRNAATPPQGTRLCTSAEVVDPTTKTVTLIPTAVATGPERTFQKLADKLRPLAQSCEPLPAAAASVRASASDLGLSESPPTYQLTTVTDNSLRCASIYETVGGTILITIRGPDQ